MKSGKHQFFYYYKNNGAADYVGSFLKEHYPLFSVSKLWRNKEINATFLLVKMLEMQRWASSGPQKYTSKDSDRFHNHFTPLTMIELRICHLVLLLKIHVFFSN